MKIIDLFYLSSFMICIYKITSPTGKIYIGQTVNFHKRKLNYLRVDCKNQTKLYNSILKYGIDNHKIEVIIECEKQELNRLERYYQDLYNTKEIGLNIRLTKSNDRSGSFSELSKLKMSAAKVGKKRSEEVKKAISEKMKLVAKERSSEYYKEFSKANIGRKHSEEHRVKNSNAKKGNKFRSNHKNGNTNN